MTNDELFDVLERIDDETGLGEKVDGITWIDTSDLCEPIEGVTGRVGFSRNIFGAKNIFGGATA